MRDLLGQHPHTCHAQDKEKDEQTQVEPAITAQGACSRSHTWPSVLGEVLFFLSLLDGCVLVSFPYRLAWQKAAWPHSLFGQL